MRLLACITALFLASCMGSPGYQGDVARFDFGPRTTMPVNQIGIARIDVTTPAWLGGSAMEYRLLYADAARRLEYSESRWAAPPAELLKQSLEHRLAAGGGRCRLRIDLDEFIQVFDSPQSSRVVVEGRVTLLMDQDVLGERGFGLSPTAPAANAKGGVVAAAVAINTLGDDLATWLAGHVGRCRVG